MHRQRLTYLLDLYLEDRLSGTELEELNRYLRQGDTSGEVRSVLQSIIRDSPEITDYQKEEWDPLFMQIMKNIPADDRHPASAAQSSAGKRILLARRIAAAAAAVIILVAGTLWILPARKAANARPPVAAVKPPSPDTDIAPGSNRATLTLADHTTIDLDNAKEGILGHQGNARLVKQKDGQLAYETTDRPAKVPALQYNLLTTPKGGQYQLVLPDGSKVWLNAASSIKYPTSFTGNQRTVELQGEAYFEIAPKASSPFRVKIVSAKETDPTQVDVLGTHFDIKAYADEPAVHTTLLEGSVKVSKGAASVLIRPGEEAHVDSKGKLNVGTADVEEAIAWKNGLFKFNEATIEDVMRQVSRWYDVDVEYVNGPPKDLFQGEIYRNASISKLLKVLEASGVHFTIAGKTIFVKA